MDFIEVLEKVTEGKGSQALASVLKKMDVDRDSRILELFAFENSTLPKLFDEGYTNLYGIDKDKRIYEMEHYTLIRYIYGNPENTHFPRWFFDYCFVQSDESHSNSMLFSEAERILKNDGIFLVQSNGDQAGRLFGLGLQNGFKPLFKKDIAGESKFILGFKKKDENSESNLPKKLTIINYTQKFGGFTEHVRLMKERLEEEYGIEVQNAVKADECHSQIVIIEYAPTVVAPDKFIEDIKLLKKRGCSVYVESHDPLCTRFTLEERRWLEEHVVLMLRANEMGDYDSVENYVLYPLFSFSNKFRETKKPQLGKPMTKDGIMLGTFGYASTWKKTDQIINMANKLGIRFKILLSISAESSNSEQSKAKELIDAMIKRNRSHKNIIIKVGDFTDRNAGSFFEQKKELIDELGECTHYVFALKSRMAPSGTMHFVKRFHRPIIGLQSFQARQMQTIRVSFFKSRIAGLSDFAYEFTYRLAARVLRGRKMEWDIEWRSFLALIDPRVRPLDKEWFEKHKELSKDEDGLEYLVTILKDPKHRTH